MKQRLLSLDLDETLIFGTKKPLEHRLPDLKMGDYFIYYRPGVKNFLHKVSNHKSLMFGIYTAATKDYAEGILSNLLPENKNPLFIFDRKRLVFREQDTFMPYSSFAPKPYIKDLKKVKNATGFGYEDIIAIDDRPNLYPRQYGNIVAVPEYLGEMNDKTLEHLWKFITILMKDSDVRRREKRGWLEKMTEIRNDIEFKM